jgi:hypothetical protein
VYFKWNCNTSSFGFLRDTNYCTDLFCFLLTDNDWLIDLFSSFMDEQRQSNWPIFLVFQLTTTDPLTYLSRILANNDRPICPFFSTIGVQRHMHWHIFLPTWIKQSLNLGNINDKIHERFPAKLFSIDEVKYRFIDIHPCIIFLSYLTYYGRVLPVILGSS